MTHRHRMERRIIDRITAGAVVLFVVLLVNLLLGC